MMKLFVFAIVSIFNNALLFANAGMSDNIGKLVTQYFKSEHQKIFSDKWQKHKKPIENAVQIALKDTFGESGMNVFIRKSPNLNILSDGFLAYDNIVYVLFKDLYLSQFPRLRAPEVSFELSSHVLKLEAEVSKIFVQADYLLFRNLTDVIYSSAPFDPYKTSPFTLQQVKNIGEATIVVEGCSLSGFTIASLHGQSVHLRHDNFRLMNCKFSVEISNPGSSSPPVISPYFSPEKGKELELLLLKVIKAELMPKLQGAIFTYVNTSAIFDEDLSKLREQQQIMFKRTLAFMSRVVTHLNVLIAKESNSGIGKLEDFTLSWTDRYYGVLQDIRVMISNVSVRGLDSIYSAQAGGPYKLPDMSIADTIRVAAVQVTGNIELDVGNSKRLYVFYGEIEDVTLYVSMRIHKMISSNKNLDAMLMKPSMMVAEWRNAEIHAPSFYNSCDTCLHAPKALIMGFLLNELPILMIQKISRHFTKAVSLVDKEDRDENSILLKSLDERERNTSYDENDGETSNSGENEDESQTEYEDYGDHKSEDLHDDSESDKEQEHVKSDGFSSVGDDSNVRQTNDETVKVGNFKTRPPQYMNVYLFDNKVHSE